MLLMYVIYMQNIEIKSNSGSNQRTKRNQSRKMERIIHNMKSAVIPKIGGKSEVPSKRKCSLVSALPSVWVLKVGKQCKSAN